MPRRTESCAPVADVLPEHQHLADAGITQAEYERFRKIVGEREDAVTISERVKKEIGGVWRTIDDVAQRTGLTQRQATNCLCAVIDREVDRVRHNGRTLYTLKGPGSPPPPNGATAKSDKAAVAETKPPFRPLGTNGTHRITKADDTDPLPALKAQLVRYEKLVESLKVVIELLEQS